MQQGPYGKIPIVDVIAKCKIILVAKESKIR
jgi:hypothetical protein